jgi:hypothetical protein
MSSALRASSHSRAWLPWHLGQCLLRQLQYAIVVCPHAGLAQRAT